MRNILILVGVLVTACGSTELPEADAGTPECSFTAPTEQCITVDVVPTMRTWLCDTAEGECLLYEHAKRAPKP